MIRSASAIMCSTIALAMAATAALADPPPAKDPQKITPKSSASIDTHIHFDGVDGESPSVRSTPKLPPQKPTPQPPKKK